MNTKLVLENDILTLRCDGFSPLWVDFNHLTWQKRRDAGRQQGLVRACKPKPGMRLLDVTAGWGRDAAILASFGAEVLMIERHPMMVALLEDGLRRMAPNSPLKLSLKSQDALSYLESLSPEDYPDVIYIDPMHPMRQKKALVKKEMQVLQQLIGVDQDVLKLLHLALQRATARVVVKWPERSLPLAPPSRTIHGKTVRFDIYGMASMVHWQ